LQRRRLHAEVAIALLVYTHGWLLGKADPKFVTEAGTARSGLAPLESRISGLKKEGRQI
jgi:hypothetical protein